MTCRQLVHALFILSLLIPLSAQAGTALSFPVTFSEPVNVTGSLRLSLDVGGVARYATYASGSGTTTLTFTYNTVVGDVDLDGVTLSSPLDLNGGTIKDLAGNNLSPLTFTLPNTANVKVDHPSLAMDFATNDYILNGTHYGSFTSFLAAAGGTFSRNLPATYFDAAGTMQTAAGNTLRFEYDPTTLLFKGVLLEPVRTNLFLRSAEFDNASWIKSSSSIVANTAIAPDGTLSAEKLVENASTGNKEFYQSRAVTSGSVYTASIFVKPAERTQVRFNSIAGSSIFTLTGSGSVVTGGSNTPSIKLLANGWYFISVKFTASAATESIYFTLVKTGIANYTGDGASGVYAWGAQFELGAYPTSYIPTTTASVLRQSDNIIIPSGTWYNQSAGAFFENVAWSSTTGVDYPLLWQVNDGTSTNRWNLYYKQSNSTLGIDAFVGGTSQGFFSQAAAVTGSVKVAAAQALNNSNAAFSGALQAVDTSYFPPPITQLDLTTGYATRWLVNTKYYPLRVTDAQLQLLSQ